VRAEEPGALVRVGLVGAGPISEFHARAISRVPGAVIVAIADMDESRARALAVKWRVARVGRTVEDFPEAGVDVVHVLTPPATHADIAVAALGRGSHVYIEKPLATTVEDCDRIEAAARKAGRAVGVGHSLLRDPSIVRATAIASAGGIGDVVAVDYVRSQPSPPHAGGPLPPYFRDGGFPFRDSGVHGLYVAEAFLGPIARVSTHVESRGRDPLVHCDEWQVIANCERGLARLHMSWAIRPWQSVLTVFGTHGIIRADLFGNTVVVRRARPLPEPVTRLVNTGIESLQLLIQSAGAVVRVARGRLRQFHGLQDLVVEFYRDLAAGRSPAVSIAAGRSAVQWTEAVAAQGDVLKATRVARFVSRPSAEILVTGAGGFVGRHLVERLVRDGHRVRALVRRDPPGEWWSSPRIELLLGDLGDPAIVDRAVTGTRLVYHLGAAMHGSLEDFDRGTIAGTHHVVESVLEHRVPRLVYMSSLAVLHSALAREGQVITETWPLEPRPNDRGHYTRTKLAAERHVLEAVRSRGLRAVVLRPGEVIGRGAEFLTAGVAQRAGRTLVVLGHGRLQVPLVAVDDVVDALIAAAEHGPFDGTVVHMVDPASVTQNDMVERYRMAAGGAWRVVHVPRPLVSLMGAAAEVVFGLLGRAAPLSRYRVASALAPRAFDCRRARDVWGWRPRMGVAAVLDQLSEGMKR
jgi:nucleoside-diphosphate-sugar epimerase/predicted dehydrogenase